MPLPTGFRVLKPAPCAICNKRGVAPHQVAVQLSEHDNHDLWPQCEPCQRRIAVVSATLVQVWLAKHDADEHAVAEGWE